MNDIFKNGIANQKLKTVEKIPWLEDSIEERRITGASSWKSAVKRRQKFTVSFSEFLGRVSKVFS